MENLYIHKIKLSLDNFIHICYILKWLRLVFGYVVASGPCLTAGVFFT